MATEDTPGAIDAARSVELTGPAALTGNLSVPGDKSISHRVLLLAAIAHGTTYASGVSLGDDVQRTRRAIEQFGAEVEDVEPEPGPRGRPRAGMALAVTGGTLTEPSAPLDLGNSGTGMRLVAGVCAGQDAFTVLTGDESLVTRPMDRVVEPLRAMGARIEGRAGGRLAPLAIRGGGLTGIDYSPPVVSAQVKSAVLLAGLFATGSTTVRESVPTRRHTEELLAEFGGDVHLDGASVTVRPAQLSAAKIVVPGDPSQAAFWVVAGLICPDSQITVEGVYLGYGRAGFLDVLRRMGANLEVSVAEGTVRASTSTLRGIAIGPDEIPALIDEVPAVAVAAAFAQGTTVISGAAELRVKESDRIASTVAMLNAFGVGATETADGMIIPGGQPHGDAVVDARGDHRLAMAACVCGLAVAGSTRIRTWDSVATSYPGFAAQVAELTGGAATLKASD
ncbi:MAG TPA: 3-phosphoshikimate 1-carboxyvinyltransferase [Streptosporangiaceae bacterium]|jgi:3-phosphoshikimate 1-carboxyvinyltransferase